MKNLFILFSCTAGLAAVAAKYDSYHAGTSGLNIMLRARDDGGTSRLAIRTLPPPRHASVAATVQGPGSITHSHPNGIEGDWVQQPVPHGLLVKGASPKKDMAKVIVSTDAGEGQHSQNWPAKSKGTGTHVDAQVKAPVGGSGHILLTAPGKPSQQIHVPGGGQRRAFINSNAHGAAKALAIASKGGEIRMYSDSVKYTPNRVNRDNVVSRQTEKDYPGDKSAGLPVQYGSRPSEAE